MIKSLNNLNNSKTETKNISISIKHHQIESQIKDNQPPIKGKWAPIKEI